MMGGRTQRPVPFLCAFHSGSGGNSLLRNITGYLAGAVLAQGGGQAGEDVWREDWVERPVGKGQGRGEKQEAD